jgi:hypothetical protein
MENQVNRKAESDLERPVLGFPEMKKLGSLPSACFAGLAGNDKVSLL